MPQPQILIVDDDPQASGLFASCLKSQGYRVEEASSCKEACIRFHAHRPDLVLCDFSLGDGNAFDLLRAFTTTDSSVPMVVITGHGSIELAVKAMKEGAEHFLVKPVGLSSLLMLIQKILDSQRMTRKAMADSNRSKKEFTDPFLGGSQAIQKLQDQAMRAAGASAPVLILGETGTGKGVLARWIHQHSPRSNEAFVDLNCAGLERAFFENELFGHQKGAYTGANQTKLGLLEVGHLGTVFLDEIGDVDLAVQPKLLKVLEEGTFRRMGDVQDRYANIRLVAATHQDLRSMVQAGTFRSDLFYRINTLVLNLPPLRERQEDIPILAHSFMETYSRMTAKEPTAISQATLRRLKEYHWPGNVRELKNLVERAAILSEGRKFDERLLVPEMVPMAVDGFSSIKPVASLIEIRREHLEETLQRSGWRVNLAAKSLGVARSTLYYQIKKLGLRDPKSAS
jgi:DNA-binding NtrC family response regulator